MKATTPCHIVRFDEFTRQACKEALQGEAYGSITVTQGTTTLHMPSWSANIGFAREIRQIGLQQGKPMKFQVVVRRQTGASNRFLQESEWWPATRGKKSLARTVNNLVRGRIGRMK